MLITLYDQYGKVKTTLSPDDTSRQDKEIQGDNVLSLSFTLYDYVSIDVNDYVDFEGEHYWAVEKYLPNEKSTVEWEYNVKLYGIESLIKRFLVLNNADGRNEAVFTLTAKPIDHVRLIVDNINSGMGGTTNFKVGEISGSDNVVIDYFGKYCDEGLKELAEKVGVEWWIEGETLNLCRCEHGEELTLGYSRGLTSLDRDIADNAKFYTRLFPIGSSRNIDPERYGAHRLQLPGGAKYVDVNVERYGIVHHYEQEAFSDIYPRRIGEVSSVRSAVVNDDDGNPFTIYYFKDESLTFDPNDYEIGGLVKHVSFQEGSDLSGLGVDDDHYFEVNYDSESGEFEIITIWPYDDDTQLPGGQLVPKVHDRYILWNIRMPDEYYGLAEKELESAVTEYNKKHALDVSRYKGETDHVWIEDEGVELYIGRRIRLESREYFPETGYRSSRITRISRHVTLPSQMDLEISDALSTGALDKIDDAISDAKKYAGSLVGGLNIPDIIKSGDTTRPTDTNIYSARRTHKEFLNKNTVDRAKKKIVFDEGIEVGDYERGVGGGRIDEMGNGELLTLVVRELLRSPRFSDGFGGEGWQLWKDEEGLSRLTIDKLTIRQTMSVFELLISKIRSVGGQLVVSAANGKIKAIEDYADYYIITFEQENCFAVGDLLRCQTFTGGEQKSYWVEVSAVQGDSVWVLKNEFVSDLPCAGDECVLAGNTINPNRRNLILISATEDGQPRIDVLDDVKDKSFSGCLRARLGNLDGIKDSLFGDLQPEGDGLYSDNAWLRGTFVMTTGEDVKTKFAITEGKITSSVEGLRDDYLNVDNHLSNASFVDGILYWETQNEVIYYTIGDKWIWSDGGMLSMKSSYVAIYDNGGRNELRIKHGSICQHNDYMRRKPECVVRADGLMECMPVTLTMYCRCVADGELRVWISGEDKTGYADYDSMDESLALNSGDSYEQIEIRGYWNGSGDFNVSCNGEVYIYMPQLRTDSGDVLGYRYRTLLEQSDKVVKIAAENFDADGRVLQESEILTTAKYVSLMSNYFNEDGSLVNTSGLILSTDLDSVMTDLREEFGESLNNALTDVVKVESFAGMFASAMDDNGVMTAAMMSAYVTRDEANDLISNVKIKADNISLEGIVTANGNFRILEDGSMRAHGEMICENNVTTVEISAESGKEGLRVLYDGHVKSLYTGSNMSIDDIYSEENLGETINVSGSKSSLLTYTDLIDAFSDNSKTEVMMSSDGMLLDGYEFSLSSESMVDIRALTDGNDIVKLMLYAEGSKYGLGSTELSASVRMYISGNDGIEYDLYRNDIWVGPGNSQDMMNVGGRQESSYKGSTLLLGAGTYKVYCNVETEVYVQRGDYPDYVSHVSSSVQLLPFMIVTDPLAYRSMVFGNGIAFGMSAANHLYCISDAYGMDIDAVAGDAGIRISHGEFRVKLGGLWYVGSRGSGGELLLNQLSN